jgi:hypothetical protein
MIGAMQLLPLLASWRLDVRWEQASPALRGKHQSLLTEQLNSYGARGKSHRFTIGISSIFVSIQRLVPQVEDDHGLQLVLSQRFESIAS